MHGVSPKRVKVAASYQESRPPRRVGSPTSRRGAGHDADQRVVGRHLAGRDVLPEADRRRVLAQPRVGGRDAAPATRVSSASTSVPQPSASALPGMYISSQVSEHDAGYVTSHSPPCDDDGDDRAGREVRVLLVRAGRATRRAAGRTASSTTPIFSIALTAPPARQCGWRISAWPGRPSTVMTGVSEPRQATQTSKRRRLRDDAGVGPHAVAHGRDAAGARGLLVGDGADDDVAGQPHAELAPAPRRRTPCSRRRPSCRTRRGRRGCRRAPRRATGRSVQRSTGSGVTTSMWPLSSSERPPPAPGEAWPRAAAGPRSPGRPRPGGCRRRRRATAPRRRWTAPRAREAVAEVRLQVGLLPRRVLEVARGGVERDQVR